MAEIVDVTVAKLSNKGEGIAFYQNLEIYIPQVLVGEKLSVELGQPFAVGSKRCPGQVVKIIEASPHRVSSYPCPYYSRCGGCQYMHVDYQEQLRVKQSDIAYALNEVLPNKFNAKDITIEALTNQNCRSKSIRYFAQDINLGLIQGFYASRSHELIAIDKCTQEVDGFDVIANSLTKLLNSLALKADQGGVKALQLRNSDDGVMALLILGSQLDEHIKEQLTAWANTNKIGSFYLGYNNQDGNSLYCEQVELIYGNSLLTKKLLNHKYLFGPQTFMQVNYDMTEKLYAQALEHCCSYHTFNDPHEDELALDLCCGVGTMTLSLAEHFKHVIGIEIIDSAIKLAQQNASINHIDNVSFIAGDIKNIVPGLLKSSERSKVKAVIADPSRAGLGNECARLLSKIPGPCAISLIFCSLTALKRDLPILLKGGFTISKVKGFDMFANTNHIETLVCLTKK